MAYCPKCKGEMLATAIACSHCGYDFPRAASPKVGLAYSPLADIALVVSMIAASVGSLASLLAMVVSLVNGQFFNGLVVAPIAFFLQLGILVVFLRVQQ